MLVLFCLIIECVTSGTGGAGCVLIGALPFEWVAGQLTGLISHICHTVKPLRTVHQLALFTF